VKRAWFLCLLLAACTASRRDQGDILSMGAWYEIGEIDPISSYSGGGYFLMEVLFDGLVKHDERFGLLPGLAERWDVSGDGKTWDFSLRKGVRFHDGHEFTSEDVIFTMQRIMSPESDSQYAFALDGVESIEEKGRYEVRVRMKEPNHALIHFCDFGIVPSHAYGGPKFKDRPIGTGPFRLEHRDERGALLRANEGYFLGRPPLNGIRVRTYKTQLEAWSRLMAGDIDVFEPVLPRNVGFLSSLPDMRLYSNLHPYYYILGFNMNDGLFKDKNVRLALNLAVDRQALVSQVLQGKGRGCSGPLFPEDPLSGEDSPIPYDPEGAIRLLKRSGWAPGRDGILHKNGRPLEFSCLIFEDDELLKETGIILQDQFSRIGVKMEIIGLPFQKFVGRFKQRSYQSVLLYYTALFDPDIHYKFLHSSQAVNGMNWLSYKNPIVDELLEKGRMEPDPEKRQRIYSMFQREIQNDPPGVFLYWREFIAGVHSRFRGVKIGPGGLLWNLGEWWVPEKEQKHRGAEMVSGSVPSRD